MDRVDYQMVNYCPWIGEQSCHPHGAMCRQSPSAGTRLNGLKIDNYSRLPLIKTVTSWERLFNLFPNLSRQYLMKWKLLVNCLIVPTLSPPECDNICRIVTCYPPCHQKTDSLVLWTLRRLIMCEVCDNWRLMTCDPWPCLPPHVSPSRLRDRPPITHHTVMLIVNNTRLCSVCSGEFKTGDDPLYFPS